MRVSNSTLTWLAALIDGEGSIMLTKRYPTKAKLKISKQPHYRCVVSVSNTQRPLLEAITERTGVGRIYEHKMPERKNHCKRAFTWRMNVTEILSLLPKVLPHLIIKREQAELLLEAAIIARQNTPQAGQPFNWEQANLRLKRRDEIHTRITQLNRKGK